MAQQQGITPRYKQGIQGFLGVNLRKDRVTLADEELAKAINAELHERPGSIILRRGRRKQFNTALPDLVVRRLALVNGVRYQIAGQSIYRDAAVVASGVLSSRLFTTMQAFRPLSDRAIWVFIADAGIMYKDNGSQLVPWGIASPTAPVNAIGAVGTGLTGAYLGGYSYIRFDDEAVAHESNVVADDAVTLTDNKLAIADIINPTDTQINGIGIYRSVADGALLLLDSREHIPTERTTFSVTHGFEVTAAPGGTVADGLQLHWSVDKGTKRGSQSWEPTSSPGLQFISSASASGFSLSMPTHVTGDLLVMFAYRAGSTSAPAVPAGWSTWGIGTGADLNASVGGYKVATSAAELSGEWTAATGLICHVYRGQRVAGAIGGVGDTGGSSSTVTYPGVVLTDTAGTSLIVTFAGHRAINNNLERNPDGTVLRSHSTGTNLSQGEVVGFDTDTAVSSWIAHSVAVGGSAYGWRARTLEIRVEPTTTSTSGTSEDAAGYRGTNLWEVLLTTTQTLTGSSLITNADATSGLMTPWTDISTGGGVAGITFAGGAYGFAFQMVSAGAGRGIMQQSITTVLGTRYYVEFARPASNDLSVRVGSSSGASDLLAETLAAPFGGSLNGLSVYFTATGTSSFIQFLGKTNSGVGSQVDNIQVFAVSSATPTPIVTTQSLRWAYASTIADSALGEQGPLNNDAPPLAEWVTEYQGSAFLTRVIEHPERLVWSQRLEPESFPTDNFLDIGTPDDPLQCALQVGGILGVFSRSTKYRVTGNVTSGFTYQEALSRRGTESPLAAIACEYGIVFVHHDGIFSTNLLSQDTELSSDIAPLFNDEMVNDMPPINWVAKQTFAGAYRKGRYYFSYASGEHLTPDTIAVLSRTTQKWYFFDHPARALYVEQGDDEALTAGFTDGFVYVLEDGESDAGSDIALDCETKDYFGGEVDVRKLYIYARVDADVPAGETLSVGLFVDNTLTRTALITGTRTRVLLAFPEASMGYTWRIRFRYTGQHRIRIYGVSAICLPLEQS